MLNELKIKRYCDNNNYNYKYFNEVAIITTGTDTWQLESIDTYSSETEGYKQLIQVKHQNKAGNKTNKVHFHTQRHAYDIDFIFNNIIIPHEQGNRVYQKAFRIKELLTHSM